MTQMTGTRWRALLAAVVPVVTASCFLGPAAPWGSPHVEVSLASASDGSIYAETDRLFTKVSHDGFCARGDDEVTLTDVSFIEADGLEVVRAGYTDERPEYPLDARGWDDLDVTTTDRMASCDDEAAFLLLEVRRTGSGTVWASGLRVQTAQAGTHEGRSQLILCDGPEGCTEEDFISTPEVAVRRLWD